MPRRRRTRGGQRVVARAAADVGAARAPAPASTSTEEAQGAAAASSPPEEESGGRDDGASAFACSELNEYMKRAHTALQRGARVTDVILDADTEVQEMLRVILGDEYEPVSLVDPCDAAFAQTAVGTVARDVMANVVDAMTTALREMLGAAGAIVPFGGEADAEAAALAETLGDDPHLDDSTHEGALAKALYRIVSLRCHPDRNGDEANALQARRRRLFVLANNAAHEQPTPNILTLAAAAAATELSDADVARLEGDGGASAEVFSYVLEGVVAKEEAAQAAREASRAYKWRRLPPVLKMTAAREMAADVRRRRAARAAEVAAATSTGGGNGVGAEEAQAQARGPLP